MTPAIERLLNVASQARSCLAHLKGPVSLVYELGEAIREVEAGPWRPIETAPNTRGERILAWCRFPAGAEVRLCTNKKAFVGSDAAAWDAYGMTQNATHWMPLPEAPIEDRRRENGE